MSHVVPIPHIGHLHPPVSTHRLHDGEQVRENLAGVEQIAEPIDNGNSRILGQFLNGLMGKRPRHDTVHVPGKYPCRIRNGFPPTQLHILKTKEKGVSS